MAAKLWILWLCFTFKNYLNTNICANFVSSEWEIIFTLCYSLIQVTGQSAHLKQPDWLWSFERKAMQISFYRDLRVTVVCKRVSNYSSWNIKRLLLHSFVTLHLPSYRQVWAAFWLAASDRVAGLVSQLELQWNTLRPERILNRFPPH